MYSNRTDSALVKGNSSSVSETTKSASGSLYNEGLSKDEAWPHFDKRTKDLITHNGIALWELAIFVIMVLILIFNPGFDKSMGLVAVLVSELITGFGCILSRWLHGRQVRNHNVKHDRFFTVASRCNVWFAFLVSIVTAILIFV